MLNREIPTPKWSASKPKASANTVVMMVLNSDCAEITEVRISLGT